MEQITLESQKRDNQTKGQLKKSRIDGLVPAIVYGTGDKSTSVFVNEKEISKIIRLGTNILINLKMNDSSKTVLIKEIQKHVVSSKLLHVDFHIISLKKEIEVDVPVHIFGECPGVKSQGGILEHVLREIKIKCLPADIPKSIDVDVSNLNIGRNISIKDIKAPPKVEIITSKDSILISVVAPTKIEEPVAADVVAAAPTEPEVIAKGKKEEEEGTDKAATPGAKPAAPAAPGAKPAAPGAKPAAPAATKTTEAKPEKK